MQVLLRYISDLLHADRLGSGVALGDIDANLLDLRLNVALPVTYMVLMSLPRLLLLISSSKHLFR